MKKTVLCLFLIGIIMACNKSKVGEFDYPVLSVDLTQTNPPSVFDIFAKIEIIPLETTDSSLIGGTGDILVSIYNNQYYIYDDRTESLYCFDEHGKFVRKIGNKGPGPEEYAYVMGFNINKYKDVIEILSFGYLYTYELSGKFVSKIELPETDFPFLGMGILNDSIRLFSKMPRNGEDQLYIYSVQSNTIVNSFYQENPVVRFITQRGYKYNDSLYSCHPLVNKVFKINQQGLEIVYAWDFGALNPEQTKFEKDIEVKGERLIQMYRSAQIKGIYVLQFQNDKYYYTYFSRFVNYDKVLHTNVFYDKRNHKKFVFENFKEDVHFKPIMWNDDYALATLLPDFSLNKFKAIDPSILDEENRQKLEAMKEDDNPFIIKYYFK